MRSAWLLAALLVPLAAAAPADPLRLAWTAHPWPDGTLRDDPPEPASLHFPPSDPTTPPIPVAFSAPAPVTFRVAAPAEARFAVVADKPLVARNGDGASFDVTLAVDGAPVAHARAALAPALLAPGDRAEVRVELPAQDVLVPEGAALSLRVTALLPAVPAEGLRIVLDKGATLRFPGMRVPDVASLRLQDAPLPEFLATEAYPAPSGSLVLEGRVTHDAVRIASHDAPPGRPVVLVLRGEEDEATAASHAHANRTRRVDAAHEFLVGATPVRVHPGVGVAVALGSGPEPVVVRCARNCPEGFEAVVRFVGADAPPSVVTDDGSVLIPPPRATTGIPVSEDAAQETPLGPVALLALLAAATARRR